MVNRVCVCVNARVLCAVTVQVLRDAVAQLSRLQKSMHVRCENVCHKSRASWQASGSNGSVVSDCGGVCKT